MATEAKEKLGTTDNWFRRRRINSMLKRQKCPKCEAKLTKMSFKESGILVNQSFCEECKVVWDENVSLLR